MSDTAACISFIGCVVIRRELLGGQGTREISTERSSSMWASSSRSPCPTGALASGFSGISIRAGNASWTGRYFEIWCFKVARSHLVVSAIRTRQGGRSIHANPGGPSRSCWCSGQRAPIPLASTLGGCRRACTGDETGWLRGAIAPFCRVWSPTLPGLFRWAASGGVVWHLGSSPRAGSTIVPGYAACGEAWHPTFPSAFGGGQGMKAIIFGAAGRMDSMRRACLAEGIEPVGVDRVGGGRAPGRVPFRRVRDLIRDSQPDLIFHLAARSTARHEALFDNHAAITTGALEHPGIGMAACTPGEGLHCRGAACSSPTTGSRSARRTSSAPEAPAPGPYSRRLRGAVLRGLGLRTYVGYLFNPRAFTCDHRPL